jgi:hypothetical protein
MVVQETVLLLAVVALLALVLARALHQAVQLVRAEARVRVLEQELAQARSAMVLAQAREWEFHRESGRHQAME